MTMLWMRHHVTNDNGMWLGLIDKYRHLFGNTEEADRYMQKTLDITIPDLKLSYMILTQKIMMSSDNAIETMYNLWDTVFKDGQDHLV